MNDLINHRFSWASIAVHMIRFLTKTKICIVRSCQHVVLDSCKDYLFTKEKRTRCTNRDGESSTTVLWNRDLISGWPSSKQEKILSGWQDESFIDAMAEKALPPNPDLTCNACGRVLLNPSTLRDTFDGRTRKTYPIHVKFVTKASLRLTCNNVTRKVQQRKNSRVFKMCKNVFSKGQPITRHLNTLSKMAVERHINEICTKSGLVWNVKHSQRLTQEQNRLEITTLLL